MAAEGPTAAGGFGTPSWLHVVMSMCILSTAEGRVTLKTRRLTFRLCP